MFILLIAFYAPAQDNKSLHDSLRKIAAQHPSDTIGEHALIQLAKTYTSDSTWFYSQKALQLAQSLHDKLGVGNAWLAQSNYFLNTGNPDSALSYSLIALKQFEELDNHSRMALACIYVAEIYKELGGDQGIEAYLNTAIGYSHRGYQLALSARDTGYMINALNEAGITYRDLGNRGEGIPRYYDTALSCYFQALDLAQRAPEKGQRYLNRLYNNISQVYTENQKDYPASLKYLQKAVALNEHPRDARNLSYNYGNIAHVYYLMGDSRHSLEYALKTLALAKELNTPDRLKNAYSQVRESYKGIGRYDSSLYYSELYHDINDSLLNLNRTRQIAEMQTRYETSKKEGEIKNLHAENSNKNRQIILLVSILVAALLSAALLLWLYRRVHKQKQVIGAQSRQLETLMKELHHRVKNNLQIVSSLLSLQAYRLDDQEAVSAIRQSQQRVLAMSMIHQRLYKTDEITSVNIKEYLTDLAESLLSSYGYDRHHFNLQVVATQDLLDVDKILILGLIVNEIITNALKYAYQDTEHPSLSISCRGEENSIVLSIKDNGPEWDTSKWQQNGGSFGRQLVAVLCKQLRARQELTMEEGTLFRFIIPRQAQIA